MSEESLTKNVDSTQVSSELGDSYESRLQRKPSKNGKRITLFREVLLRHGLFVLLIALSCLLLPNAAGQLSWGLAGPTLNPLSYLIGLLSLSIFFTIFILSSNKKLDLKQIVWVVYLLLISVCEEWAFRLAIPSFLEQYLSLIPAIVVSNLLFALMHFFTLRWRPVWCIGAFFGAMGLSNLMSHGDLLLLVGVHWFATFLNTPHPLRNVQRERPLV